MPSTQIANTSLKDLLGELVKFPTFTGEQATNRAALDWVKYQLRNLPLTVHEYDNQGYAAAVFTTQPTKHPKVMLLAHMDVVPAPVEALTMTEQNGRYYGRGVYDMKIAIALYLKLLLELGDKLPQYDFGVMLTTDEETSGDYGVGHLVNDVGWRADVVLNLDSSGNWQIEEMAKGVLNYTLTATGQSAHASRPWAGQNAITALIACLQELAGHFPTEPCQDPKHAHDTLNIGVIAGGTVANQIPDQATADINIRFMPTRSPEAFTELVEQVASHHPNIHAQFTRLGTAIKPIADNPYARLMELLIAKVAGTQAKYQLSHGASDSRFFAAHGIPTIMTGPPGGNHHADGEWIEAKGCDQMYRIVHEFVREIAKI